MEFLKIEKKLFNLIVDIYFIRIALFLGCILKVLALIADIALKYNFKNNINNNNNYYYYKNKNSNNNNNSY